MKISLITINRNNAEGLKRTLRSVADQLPGLGKDVTLEHIIVDGKSDDGSLNFLHPELESKVETATPMGVYNAINKGIKMATGDVVGLLHSGDVFCNETVLNEVSAAFRSDKKPDFIWGDVKIGKRLISGKDYSPSELVRGNAPGHPSLYVTRETIDYIGLYDETFTIAGDFDYFVRLFNTPDLSGLYSDKVCIEMEPGGMTQSFANRVWHNNTERLRVLRKHGLPASRLKLLSHYKKVLNELMG